ncbi:hypothetical protein BLOT_011969 [Blomia tropicalis]|nr:hypothetical protein BLOT_011969 [Blomia tropicalis]
MDDDPFADLLIWASHSNSSQAPQYRQNSLEPDIYYMFQIIIQLSEKFKRERIQAPQDEPDVVQINLNVLDQD